MSTQAEGYITNHSVQKLANSITRTYQNHHTKKKRAESSPYLKLVVGGDVAVVLVVDLRIRIYISDNISRANGWGSKACAVLCGIFVFFFFT